MARPDDDGTSSRTLPRGGRIRLYPAEFAYVPRSLGHLDRPADVRKRRR
ncbi:hypothetical protein L842_2238 [Mycobacterium intracellulare MIN_052511_1280]|nr:hypothetical protein L842_2238 [Mycobacterium intracellulare MIN_052511_1280]